MPVRVLAFARAREVLGFGVRELPLSAAPTTGALRTLLERDAPGLAALRDSTRLARNGEVISGDVALCEGDEVALLPPVGGG